MALSVLMRVKEWGKQKFNRPKVTGSTTSTESNFSIKVPEWVKLINNRQNVSLDTESYNFPKIRVDNTRERLLDLILPELSKYSTLKMNKVIDGIVNSLDKSDPNLDEVWGEIIEALMAFDVIDNVHDLKVFILQNGLTEEEIEERFDTALEPFLLTTPKEDCAKEDVKKLLQKLKGSHYLILRDTETVWRPFVENGFLSVLHDSDELITLMESTRDHVDISEFITNVLSYHDWEQHFPSQNILPAGTPNSLLATSSTSSLTDSMKRATPLTQATTTATSLTKSTTERPLAQIIMNEILSSEYECLICYAEIKPTHTFWNCGECHKVYHSHCIRDWSTHGSSTEYESGEWSCPACRYIHSEMVFTFQCWCKTVVRPMNRKCPGSCGYQCGEMVQGAKCTLTCHPGPHVFKEKYWDL